MDNNELFKEFSIPENKKRLSFFVYLKIVILPILVYLFFVFGYFKIVEFGVGLHTILMMGVILLVALVFARHSAEYGCCLFEQRSVEFKRDLKEYIMNSLLTIGKKTKSNADFDEFVANYTSEVRDDNYASVGAGVFPMLGIMGTFLSIAISMPSFSSSDAASLENEISILLNGVGTAFYVSIYGIFLALWWIFFERFGMSHFRKLVNRQKLSTKSFFWTKDEINQKYMEESLGSFAKIGTVFEYVSNQEFFKELDNVVERKFTNFQNMLNTEESAIKLGSEHIKQTMGYLLKSQKDQKDLLKIHSEIINVLHMFNQNLSQMQISSSEQFARLRSLDDEKLARVEKSVIGLGNDISRFNARLEKFSGEILDKQQLALNGFKAAMLDGMRAFREVFEDEGADGGDSENLIEELKKSIQEIDNDANDALEKLGGKSSSSLGIDVLDVAKDDK